MSGNQITFFGKIHFWKGPINMKTYFRDEFEFIVLLSVLCKFGP